MTTRAFGWLGAITGLVLAAALATVGCTTGPSVADLSYSNGTTIPIELVVNGAKIATLAPGSAGSVPAAALPSQPWVVRAETAAGRLLGTMTVQPGDVQVAGNAQRGDGLRVDLSCGRLDIWSGPPMLGPAPGPGSPGDCNP